MDRNVLARNACVCAYVCICALMNESMMCTKAQWNEINHTTPQHTNVNTTQLQRFAEYSNMQGSRNAYTRKLEWSAHIYPNSKGNHMQLIRFFLNPALQGLYVWVHCAIATHSPRIHLLPKGSCSRHPPCFCGNLDRGKQARPVKKFRSWKRFSVGAAWVRSLLLQDQSEASFHVSSGRVLQRRLPWSPKRGRGLSPSAKVRCQSGSRCPLQQRNLQHDMYLTLANHGGQHGSRKLFNSARQRSCSEQQICKPPGCFGAAQAPRALLENWARMSWTYLGVPSGRQQAWQEPRGSWTSATFISKVQSGYSTFM